MIYPKELSINSISYKENDDFLVADVQINNLDVFKDIFHPCAKHILEYLFGELIYQCYAYVTPDYKHCELKMFIEENNPEYVDEYISQLTKQDEEDLINKIIADAFCIGSINNKTLLYMQALRQ